MAPFFKGSLVALIGSVIANLVVLFILKPLVINPALPLHSLSVVPVTLLTIMGVVGAIIVYALMRQFLKSPNLPFVWVSIVVLIISFIPDFLIIGMTSGPFAGANLYSALTLALMHVVAAIIVVWALVKLWGKKPTSVTPAQTA